MSMTSGTEATRVLIEAFNAAWNAHDLERALALCRPDVVFESTDPAPDGGRFEGRDAVRGAWAPIFDDSRSHFDTEDMLVLGDRVVQRWRFSWGSGHIRGVDVIAVRHGLVAEKLSYVKG